MRAAYSTVSAGAPPLAVGSSGTKLTASVVFGHGLGDTAQGWREPATWWASRLPWVRFLLLNSPSRPVSLNNGFVLPAWYDIVGLDERSNENCAGIEESRARIAQILQKEHEATGLPYSR